MCVLAFRKKASASSLVNEENATQLPWMKRATEDTTRHGEKTVARYNEMTSIITMGGERCTRSCLSVCLSTCLRGKVFVDPSASCSVRLLASLFLTSHSSQTPSLNDTHPRDDSVLNNAIVRVGPKPQNAPVTSPSRGALEQKLEQHQTSAAANIHCALLLGDSTHSTSRSS